MLIKDEICKIKNKECKHLISCRYLKHRFGALEVDCMPVAERMARINKVSHDEIEKRNEIVTWSERKDYLVKEC